MSDTEQLALMIKALRIIAKGDRRKRLWNGPQCREIARMYLTEANINWDIEDTGGSNERR